MENEIWKDIAGYEGKYQVSNMGIVRSTRHRSKVRIKYLSLCPDGFGYLMAHLYHNGKHRYYKAHKAVMDTFTERQEGKQVNHKNGIKSDNRLENLEWCTCRENIRHAFSTGLMLNNHLQKNHPLKGKFGKDNIHSKPVLQYDLKGNFIKEWGSLSDIGRELGTGIGNISSCFTGKRKKAKGFVWKLK